MGQQDRTPQEVRITVSVGPEDNILGHEEVFILNHAERESIEDLQSRVAAAVHLAIMKRMAGGPR